VPPFFPRKSGCLETQSKKQIRREFNQIMAGIKLWYGELKLNALLGWKNYD
jgi:hypothetical protein